MAKVKDKAMKFMKVSNQKRTGPSVPKSQPSSRGSSSGQLQTSMVARVIKGPDQGDG